MKHATPNQIVLGGCLLAFGASFVNTGFLVSTGTSVSHLTGDIGRLGSGLFTSNQPGGGHLAMVLVATVGFLLGATLSGFLMHHPTLELSRPYGRTLSVLGLCLIAADGIHETAPLLAIGIAGAVCGAQNALANRYRGVVLRTTHLTGIFTDFGIHLGMKLRGHDIENWKLFIPVWITLFFLLGAITCGAYMFLAGRHWLLAAGLGYGMGGIAWSVCKRWRK